MFVVGFVMLFTRPTEIMLVKATGSEKIAIRGILDLNGSEAPAKVRKLRSALERSGPNTAMLRLPTELVDVLRDMLMKRVQEIQQDFPTDPWRPSILALEGVLERLKSTK